MKVDNFVVGIIIICIAALLFADAYLTTWTPAGQILSPNDVKGITGMAFAVIAALLFKKAIIAER